jgi:hypothetical protein
MSIRESKWRQITKKCFNRFQISLILATLAGVDPNLLDGPDQFMSDVIR